MTADGRRLRPGETYTTRADAVCRECSWSSRDWTELRHVLTVARVHRRNTGHPVEVNGIVSVAIDGTGRP